MHESNNTFQYNIKKTTLFYLYEIIIVYLYIFRYIRIKIIITHLIYYKFISKKRQNSSKIESNYKSQANKAMRN